MPMLSMSLPENFKMTCNSLKDIANLNVIPKDKFEEFLKPTFLSNG